ncbi:MAG: helix-turn-helix domain-containing protein [Microcystis panniformis]
MKARYRHRIYPNGQQQERLTKLFGCVRSVANK